MFGEIRSTWLLNSSIDLFISSLRNITLMRTLTDAQRLKFHLLASGIRVPDAREYLVSNNGGRNLTPADFASTTGLILRLEDDVWVNAPIVDFNPNFVSESPFQLDFSQGALVVRGQGLESAARFWLSPRYHDGSAADSSSSMSRYVFTHGDRVRLSPVRGCAMACKFCNIPYEDTRYGTKPLDEMVKAVAYALHDDIQPAHHVLISGGTPKPGDIEYLQKVYSTLLKTFPDVEVDIMMAPVRGLFDYRELADLGLHQLSINLELFDPSSARRLMPHKYRQGSDLYLGAIAEASSVMGPGRVRSMLMVGLEPIEQTMSGVEAIAERGGVPVLSPFRPDPSTPLRDVRAPSSAGIGRSISGRRINWLTR